MREERLEVSVTFDERRGYIGSAPELRSPVVRSLTNGLPSRTNVCTRRKRTCGPQGGSPGFTHNGHRLQQRCRFQPYQFQGVGGRGRGPLPTDFVSFCCGPRANERASFASV
jgi:hypothetical protein